MQAQHAASTRHDFWHDCYSLSLSESALAQDWGSGIPDSVYVRDELIIWFKSGQLNPDYLGCELLFIDKNPPSLQSLPLDTTFIYSSEIVGFLAALDVQEIRKLIPEINPCVDTVSYALSGNIMRMPHFWNALIVRFNAVYDMPALANILMYFFSDKILWVQPNFTYDLLDRFQGEKPKLPAAIAYPSDTLYWLSKGGYPAQYALKSGKDGYANIDSAWEYTRGDSAIRIGVIDGGFDYRHPDLGGGAGAGYRVKGAWNYMERTEGADTYSHNNISYAHVGHGTKVLSVIGAISNNTLGLAGICGGDSLNSGASLYCFRAATSGTIANAIWEASANTGTLPGSGGADTLWQCDILCVAASYGLYGPDAGGRGYQDELVRSFIAFRYMNGRTTFCAYGNSDKRHVLENVDTTYAGSPQDVDKEWVITVSSTFNERVEVKHDWGANLDLLAPGQTAACSIDTVAGGIEYTFDKRFTNTSCSAPIAAGIGGLLLSYHRNLTHPTPVRQDSIPAILYPEDVEWLMKHSAQQHHDLPRCDEKTGWGAVKGGRCLRLLNNPFILIHDSIRYADENPPVYEEDTLAIAFPGWQRKLSMQPFDDSWKDETFRVKRYRLASVLAIDRSRLGLGNARIAGVWGRGGNPYTGYGNPIKLKKPRYRVPLYRVGYCGLVGDSSFTQNQMELETYVYKVWKWLPDSGRFSSDSAWIPCPPDSVWYTYSILADTDVQTSIPALGIPDDLVRFHVYPQPAGDYVMLSSSPKGGEAIDVRIYDLYGREVPVKVGNSTSETGYHFRLETGRLPSGIYVVRMLSAQAPPVSKRIVIAR